MTSLPFSVLLLSLVLLSLSLPSSLLSSPSCSVSVRDDCGYVGINQQQCENRNCCWSPQPNSPYCFYAVGQSPFWVTSSITTVSPTLTNMVITPNNVQGQYGTQPTSLLVTIQQDSADRVHVKITDPNTERYEIPTDIVTLQGPQSFTSSNVVVNTSAVGEVFTVTVYRIVDNYVILSLSDLQFTDQYLTISNLYPNLGTYYPNIYGIGEHVDPLRSTVDNHQYTLWNVDVPTPVDQNVYGSHPMYLQMVNNGNAHVTYLHSSNGMDIVVGNDRVTYKPIGGIIDIYSINGPTPEQAIRNYHTLIGYPHLPPYWSLGWHQCQYGYPNVQYVTEVVHNYSVAGIPLDTMWNDIDYMDQYKDFTWDPVNYPEDKVVQYVEMLHSNGQHYVVIVDPGIHNLTGYGPFDRGLSDKIFMTNADGQTPFIGTVWPGTTAFPDFLNPDATQYWYNEINTFLQGVSVDGLWIDMNEISNFENGIQSSSPSSKYNNPPYAINNFNQHFPLNYHTIAMDALHYNGLAEYNVHNMYGMTESISTRVALEKSRGKRAFILSRSTFPSSGVHAAHWLGDNYSTFESMQYSIAGVLTFNMYGVPLVGADICGFIGDTTEELCNRWTQLGAFYPFSRNHNAIHQTPQEPYRWASVTKTAKQVLGARYSLLPYLYTQFWLVNQRGGTVAKPLFFIFPTDTNTWGNDQQYFLGPALFISPVLQQGATTVNTYFSPQSVWYEYWTGYQQLPTGYQTLNTPLTHIQVHAAGGNIIPCQYPMLTTTATRLNDFFLLVAGDANGNAAGELYWDDGETLNYNDNTEYLHVSFLISQRTLTTNILNSPSPTVLPTIPPLDEVRIWGVMGSTSPPPSPMVNGVAYGNFAWDRTNGILKIMGLGLAMTKEITISY